MEFTVQQIADYLKGTIEGDASVKVSELSKIEEGRPGTLTFLSNPKYMQYIYTTQASACLVNKDFVAEKELTTTLIRVDNAYECLAKLLTLVDSMKPKKQGVSAKSDVHESAKIGENVYIGAFVVIGAGVEIGDNVQIYPNTFIDDNVTIGEGTVIYAGVKIYEGCRVGKHCVLHAGAVVGSDGFGHAPDAEGHYHKIPQIGNVVIEDDVELGANTTVDRATMGSTIIRRGVKIDNLVQVAHNVEIGEDTVIAAQSGIAGSTTIGRRCMLGGQVGISGHITIADGSIFGAQSGVPSNIKEPNQIWQGYPVMPIMGFRRLTVLQKQLPDLSRRVHELEKKIK